MFVSLTCNINYTIQAEKTLKELMFFFFFDLPFDVGELCVIDGDE